MLALAWTHNETLTPERARQEIITISDWGKKTFGYFQDTSIQDTADRIFRQYYGFQDIEIQNAIKTNDSLRELQAGHIVSTTIDGQKNK